MKNKKAKKVKDYSKLPCTRKEQCGDVLHTDFLLLIKISLINLLFSLPLIITFCFFFFFIASLEAYTFNKVFPITFYMGLIAIIPFCICGISKGATFNCLKKRCFNEGFFLMPFVFKSIKQNIIKYIFGYLLVGIAYLICSNGIVYFIYLKSNPFIKGLGIGVFVLYFIFQYAATTYFINFINLYTLSFKDGMKNGFSFVFINFPFMLAYTLIAVFLPITLMSFSIYGAFIVLFVYYIGYQGICMLCFTLHTLNKFDIYINKDNYPDFVKKGLSKEDNSCQN